MAIVTPTAVTYDNETKRLRFELGSGDVIESTFTLDVNIPMNTDLPAISGTFQENQTLTASTGAWTNDPTSYTYQWDRAGTQIDGAAASTYILVSADVGNSITVSVTATNSDGSSLPAESSATPLVTAAEPSQGGVSPSHFALGLQSVWHNQSWMPDSGVPWDYRYTYLNHDWETWNSPPGEVVTIYAQFSVDNGYIPVFSWYYAGSLNIGASPLFAHLSDTAKMNTYFTSFKLLLQKAGAFSSRVVVHVEPDMWAFMQQQASNDPNTITVSVASSGFDEVSGFANTASGFAQALIELRDTYAPNVIMAIDNCMWAVNYEPTSGTDPAGAGNAVASFYQLLGASFDLIFYNTSDRDSGYKVAVLGQATSLAWWTDTTFDRFRQYVSTITEETAIPGMMWQTPAGNTLYLTCDNTAGHYQDNRPEYFLKDGNRGNIEAFVGAGLIGVMFASGDAGLAVTSYFDQRGDGITNPPAINGNTLVASYSDDDGGFLRVQGAAYYSAGPVPLVLSPAPGPLPQNAASCRYVRMHGTERNGMHAGYSLWEMEVYGASSSVNLAINKLATASSVFDGTHPASAAFDGDTTTTRWASDFSGVDPQWIYVDLESVHEIIDIAIVWQDAYAKSYTIQVSADGSTWKDVFATTAGAGGIVDIEVSPDLPVVSGTAEVGQTLTSTTGTWTNNPTSFAHQWNRAGTPIGGATASTYVPIEADVGSTLTVSVVATNSGGASLPATSHATSAVIAAVALVFPPETTNRSIIPMVSMAVPGYLSPTTDPSIGNRLIRISDEATFGGATLTGVGSIKMIKHHYAKNQPWNADESLIYLLRPSALLDGTSYQYIRRLPFTGYREHVWSNTNKDIMYAIKGTSIVTANVSTDVETTVASFTQYSALSLGDYEGNLSDDDRYMAIMAISGSSLVVFTYDLVDRVVVGSRTFQDTNFGNNINFVTMTPSRQYVAILFTNTALGFPARSMQLYDLRMNHLRQVAPYASHVDFTYDTDGNEVIVGMRSTTVRNTLVYSSRLSDGVERIELPEGAINNPTHTSCRSTKRPGWAYISDHAATDPTHPISYYDGYFNYNEVFALKLDGTGTIARFGKLHHITDPNYDARTNDAYNRAAMAVPSRHGDRVMFASDWGDVSLSAFIHTYVTLWPST